MSIKTIPVLLLCCAMLPGLANAGEGNFYISGSFGINNQDDVTNKGTFTQNFTTGAVTGVTPPLSIPAGNDVEWDTELDRGDTHALAVGWQQGNFRVELEYSASNADIDSHENVSAAGIALGAIDAGVLISGNVGDLGISVANLVAPGAGEIETSTLFLNGFYDFDTGTALTPFIGAGIGTTKVEVEYNPSGVGIIDDEDRTFAYQFAAGAFYTLTDNMDVMLTINYVDGDEATVDSSLLPAKFDIENESINYRLGLRYRF